HRPYDLHSPAPASRTFWNQYETGLLVKLWLEFEPQFTANKRNAAVWAQLAERLTKISGRQRVVRECRIKWKNMWAKHRDLVNASHMGIDAKLREFPHFVEFTAIRQRSTNQSAGTNEGSEGDITPSMEDRPTVPPRAPPVIPFAPGSDEGEHAQLRESHLGSTSPTAAHAGRWRPNSQPCVESGGSMDICADSSAHCEQRSMHIHSYDLAEVKAPEHRRQTSLASILIDAVPSAPVLPRTSVSSSALQDLLAPRTGYPAGRVYQSSAAVPKAAQPMATVGCSSRGSSVSARSYQPDPHVGIDELPELLHRLDRLSGAEESFEEDGAFRNNSEQCDKVVTEEGMLERMRTLAGTSSATDISNAVNQIVGYVERESQRRQLQSERHHRVVTALADILGQTCSPPGSRQVSGSAYGLLGSTQQASAHSDTGRNGAIASHETTPTISPAVSTPTSAPAAVSDSVSATKAGSPLMLQKQQPK
ncbi:hypothetical protein GGF37_003281, partial [Kickxella alabastrina]